MSKDDILDDYEFTRSKYYDLIEKNDEAIQAMLDLAKETEHPRAYEVLSNMIKQNAELADRFMELHKKKRDAEKNENNKQIGAIPGSLTQNNVFIGTTTDLQRNILDNINSGQEIDYESN